MNIEIVGRQLDITPALKKFTQDRLKKIGRLLDDPLEIHVVLATEKHRQLAEIQVQHKLGRFAGAEETEDLYASIREVAEKIEKQIRRLKDRVTDHKHRRGPRHPDAAAEIAAQATPPMPGDDAPRAIRLADGSSRLLRERAIDVPRLGVEEAAARLTASGGSVLLFRDRDSGAHGVLRDEGDGTLLWLRSRD